MMKSICCRGEFRAFRHGWHTLHVFFNRRLSMAFGYNGKWRVPCLRCADIGLARTLEFYAGPFVLAFIGRERWRGVSWWEWFDPIEPDELLATKAQREGERRP